VTGSLGRLSASFDGLTLDENEGFEHKALNDAIRAAFDEAWKVRADDAAPGRMLPIYHRVQMEQQLHVSGAERILFMASAWTADEELIEERHCWYYPDAKLRQQIIDGWAQFERDLAAYTPTAAADPAPVGQAPESLPALRIEVTGEVTASNLAEFKQTALAAIRSVNRDLKTDADFADAEKAVKWCGDVESRLKAAKEHALSQTASIDALFKTIDDIGAEAKRVRLDLDKLVTRRKDECKEAAVSDARAALQAHVDLLNAELAPMRLLPVTVDFAGAIKGLRSIASMQDALDTALARARSRPTTRRAASGPTWPRSRRRPPAWSSCSPTWRRWCTRRPTTSRRWCRRASRRTRRRRSSASASGPRLSRRASRPRRSVAAEAQRWRPSRSGRRRRPSALRRRPSSRPQRRQPAPAPAPMVAPAAVAGCFAAQQPASAARRRAGDAEPRRHLRPARLHRLGAVPGRRAARPAGAHRQGVEALHGAAVRGDLPPAGQPRRRDG
jgi:predicted phage-related endonuclease